MSRVHLFEIEDQHWFPAFLRNYMTDFLQFLANQTNMYQNLIPIVEKGIHAAGNDQIIDLASGGGGGLVKLNESLRKSNPSLKILLTDYYPNIPAFEYTKNQAENITYRTESINAMNVPENLKGLRTQFLSFHHFKPRDAQKILQNAVDAKSPILIVEGQERSFISLLAMFFSPISVLFMTPMIKPFKFGRFIFTYLIPIVPIAVWWDGIVSSLRTYSVKEMQGLVNQIHNKDDFEWDIGKVKAGPAKVLYLLGTPKK